MDKHILLLLLTLCTAGCATMINGHTQQIPVTSTPSGAAVTARCAGEAPRNFGTTPATVTLHRDADGCVITLTAHGYRTAAIDLRKAHSAAAAADVVPGVFAGMARLILLIHPGKDDDSDPSIFDAGRQIGGAARAPLDADEKNGAAYRFVPERVDVTLERAW